MGTHDPGLTADQKHQLFVSQLTDKTGSACVERTLAYLGVFLTSERLRRLHNHVRYQHVLRPGALCEHDVQDDVSRALEKVTRFLIQQANGDSTGFTYNGQSEEDFFSWIRRVAGWRVNFDAPSAVRESERSKQRDAKHFDNSIDAEREANEKPTDAAAISYAHSVLQKHLVDATDLENAFEAIPAISRLVIALAYDVHEFSDLSCSNLVALSARSGCTRGQVQRFNFQSATRTLAKIRKTRQSAPLTLSELEMLLNMSVPTIRKHRDAGLHCLGETLQQ